ncbi:MAG: 3-phosphoshikimate 1-carboxyvinyltransferase [Treponema sp.]|nr:3-phosphoshikimate 1-carboxyvinyltransferase [Treponema sp.]
MDIISKKTSLQGNITVPGSKSHTIRALLLASLAEGTSYIHNPLESEDCISAKKAIPLIGAKVLEKTENGKKVWAVEGAGQNVRLPENVIDVGDSGSLLYFMSPIVSTFDGWSVFTGDESIRKRPVRHVVDALNQLGCEAYCSSPFKDAPPLLIKGPVQKYNVVTGGELSQYISGMMMAATRLQKPINITLTNPKETPYLLMTKQWLESLGVKVQMSSDFKNISVWPKNVLPCFTRTIPSDWEAVAFPLIASLITDSEIVISNVDSSGSQGDDAIVGVLQSVGADIVWDKNENTLLCRGGKKSTVMQNGCKGRLSTEHLPNKTLRVNLSSFPDALCALAVIACFIEGTTVLEDLSICRKKETDRVRVMNEQLSKLGASIEEGSDYLVIHGHSPITETGSKNNSFSLHGGEVESYGDHRVAMSLACLGLSLEKEIVVKGGECCAVSFPNFVDAMNTLGAGFQIN